MSRLEHITHALSNVQRAPDAVTPETVATLTRALIESFENETEFERLEDEYASDSEFGDLQLSITMALLKLKYGDAEWFVPNIIRYLNSDPQLHELAEAALNLSFPITDDRVSYTASLTQIQQDVIDAILANEFVWKSNPDFGVQLASRGLPSTRQDLAGLGTNNAG